MSTLLGTIEKGNFKDLGKPDRVIETAISKLFFFKDEVYKVYKYNKAYFADLSDAGFRHEFYHDDFVWNQVMAPDIYIKLGYVKNINGTIVESSRDDSDDYYILMKKINDSKTLFNLLKNRSVEESDLMEITREMFKRTEKLTKIRKSNMQDLFKTPYKDLELRDLESTREWLYMTPEIVSKSEADKIVDRLKAFVSSHTFFESFREENYLASIDNHSGNILYFNGEVSFIDSMPPMRIWRVQSDVYSISRPATDVEVILGKEYADAMYDEFEKLRNTTVAPEIRSYLQAIASLIMAPYMVMAPTHTPEDKKLANGFLEFAQRKLSEI